MLMIAPCFVVLCHRDACAGFHIYQQNTQVKCRDQAQLSVLAQCSTLKRTTRVVVAFKTEKRKKHNPIKRGS